MAKKIAIISNSFPPLYGGGIGTAHYNLYRLLKGKGYEVKIFTYLEDYKNLINREKEEDISRFGPSKFELNLLFYKSLFIRKFKKWLLNKNSNELAFQYSIVQKANLGSKKINKLLIEYKPQIIFIPDFGAPGYSIAKIPNAKLFQICHHDPMRMIDNPLIDNFSIEDAKLAAKVEQNSLVKIDKIICVSNFTKELFFKTYSFNGPVVVLPNIVDDKYILEIKRQDLHGIMRLDSNNPIIYIPAGGSKIKGEQFVIEIIRRISHSFSNNVGFYVSGILSKAQQYELSFLKGLNIYVAGDITNDENISFVKDCQLCVSPTHTENYSMALVEALFTEVPCVVFDVGGNGDIVIDDKTGYIVPYCDMEALIDKSLNILNSQQLQNELRKSIRLFNEEKSASKIIDQYVALF